MVFIFLWSRLSFKTWSVITDDYIGMECHKHQKNKKQKKHQWISSMGYPNLFQDNVTFWNEDLSISILYKAALPTAHSSQYCCWCFHQVPRQPTWLSPSSFVWSWHIIQVTFLPSIFSSQAILYWNLCFRLEPCSPAELGRLTDASKGVKELLQPILKFSYLRFGSLAPCFQPSSLSPLL